MQIVRFALIVLFALGCRTIPKQDGEILTARAYIRADYDDVWERFTDATAYEAWFSSPCREFGKDVGDPVVWGSADCVVYRGRLESIDKGAGLAHTIQFQGFGFEEPPTLVQIMIRAQGPTVLVTIRHDCRDAPQTSRMISSVGWVKALSRLKTLLETDEPMPWPEEASSPDPKVR